MLQILSRKHFHIFGNCFHENGKQLAVKDSKHRQLLFNDKKKKKQSGKLESFGMNAYVEIAEIEMLRKGAILINTIQSDQGRVVNYLRYPNYANTFNMIPYVSKEDPNRLQEFF